MPRLKQVKDIAHSVSENLDVNHRDFAKMGLAFVIFRIAKYLTCGVDLNEVDQNIFHNVDFECIEMRIV